MNTGWTGGQYSVDRGIFGGYLFVHFLQLLPWGPELFSNQGALKNGAASPLLHLFPNILAVIDTPAFVQWLLTFAVGLSVLFAIGWRDRIAAVLLWYVWACLHGRMPLITNPGMPYVGWLLLAHACLPSAPYLSLAACGRLDPDGGWRMNHAIWSVAWFLMAIGYTYSGLTKLGSPSWLDGTALERVLENPLARPGWPRDMLMMMPTSILKGMTYAALALEIGFAPLAMFRRLRPWLWLAMLVMHLSLMLVIDFVDLSLGMVILHLFTFDPAWIKPLQSGITETIFYDGECGLCHRAVRFVLAEDRSGATFRFAPLQGNMFRKEITEVAKQPLPDSIVIRTADGRLLTRSRAVFHILRRLGGLWRVIAVVRRVAPSSVWDLSYDGIARTRKRLFTAPSSACPLLPAHMRNRFLE